MGYFSVIFFHRREDSESDGEEEFYYTEIEVVDDASGVENNAESLPQITNTPPSTTNILPSSSVLASSHIPMSTSTPILTHMKTSEPIPMKPMIGIHDHDYQKKVRINNFLFFHHFSQHSYWKKINPYQCLFSVKKLYLNNYIRFLWLLSDLSAKSTIPAKNL